MNSSPRRTLTIKVQSEQQAIQDSAERFLQAWNSGCYAGEHLTFTSPAMLFTVLNARRWELVTKLQSLGKVSIRELARQLGRDVHRVHDDIKALLAYGIIEQDAAGVYVPYAEIHADFTLMAAAA